MLTEKEAIKASIEHWDTNVYKAKQGTLELKDIYGRNCALCNYSDRLTNPEDSISSCTVCPLFKAGYGCGKKESPWILVYDQVSINNNSVAACENMLKTLESLL